MKQIAKMFMFLCSCVLLSFFVYKCGTIPDGPANFNPVAFGAGIVISGIVIISLISNSSWYEEQEDEDQENE